MLCDVLAAVRDQPVDQAHVRAERTGFKDVGRRGVRRHGDHAAHARVRGIGRRGAAGVTSRRKRDGFNAKRLRHRNSRGLSTCLERRRRVHAFVFDVEPFEAQMLT